MKGPKILYVEDEEFLGKIVKESLVSRNYDVCMVTDGADVLDAYHAFRPDVCVLDIMLPNVDGFQLAQQIKATKEPPPIIFLSAKSQTEDVVAGFGSGASDYLRKPFSMEELIVRIENLLNRNALSESNTDTDFTLGLFQFSSRRQELISPNQNIQLSHRENELLHYLVEHREDIIERKKLLLALWGDDSYFNSRNLDVYVKKLRDYLKADQRIKIITLNGIGYRFLAP